MPTKNQDPADSYVVTRLARRSELLYDLLHGTDVRNPRGKLGVDMSGAPFGQRLEGTMVTFSGLVPVVGWSRGLPENTVPLRWSGNFWNKPGTDYQTLSLTLFCTGDGTSGTVTGTINGVAVSEAFTGSTSGEVLSLAASVPLEPGVNVIELDLDCDEVCRVLSVSLS